MKLLQINSVVNIYSTGRIVEQIGNVAIKNGWDSYIAYGRDGRESSSKLIKIGNKLDVLIHGIFTRIFDKHGLYSTRATKHLVTQIETIKPDIIHLHNIHGYYINYKVLFDCIIRNQIPVIWTLHDCWVMTGHCTYFTYIGCDKWQKQCLKCPNKHAYPASYLFDNSIDNYLTKKYIFNLPEKMVLVPVSNWLGNIVKHSYFSKYPINVINNGVDIETFYRRSSVSVRKKYSLHGKYILLGVATSWGERKGLKDYYKLSELLSDEYQIVLVGLSPKQLKCLPDKIIGIQKTDSVNELAELYSLALSLVNLTYDDNFPTVNIESLACGTPVITYRTGGSPEAISVDTGIVVEQGDISQVIDAIKQITFKGELYYVENCRRRAENLYNQYDRYNDYIVLYTKLLNKEKLFYDSF